MRKLLFILIIASTLQVTAQNPWQRSVVNYSRQSYHSGNQNWQIDQSREGWMYFANNNGLLEYDGHNWNTYSLPGRPKVRSLQIVGDTIYVGALGQFGRFVRNDKGRMIYQNLSGQTSQKGQVNVWHIHRIGKDIYFQSDDAFFINDGKSRLACQPGVHYSAVIYNRLYVTSYKGLCVLSGKTFVPLPGIDHQQTSDIVAILPWQGKLLLVTSNKGLFFYSENRLQPFHAGDGRLFDGIQLSCAALCGSTLALGTMQDGIILLDLNTNKVEKISVNNGLQNKTVLSVAFDNDQNLWLALDNGIDCVQLRSPLRFLNSRQSPIGSGNCSVTYQGKLYFGTNQGLYVMEGDGIKFIEGTGSQVLCLDTIGGQLFCGGRQFFLNINGDRTTRYDNRGVWGVRRLNNRPDVLLTSSYWGLRLMRQSAGVWQMSDEVKGASISAKTFFVEDITDAVWVANKEKGLYRLSLADDCQSVKGQKCYNSPLLPKGDNVYIAKVEGEMVVASRQGLFRYDAVHDKLVRHTALESRLNGAAAYTYISQAADGSIWYASDGAMHFTDGHRHRSYLNDCMMEDFESVSFTDRGQAVIGTEDGFALLENHRQADSVRQVVPYIRRVIIGNNADTLYYQAECPLISWRNNSLHFEYSANNFDPTQTVTFCYWLEGSGEQEWSSHTRLHVKDYTNIPEGNYVFHVRVITADGGTGGETSFAFTVLPPWYRTWWAYVIYLLLTVAALFAGLIRINRSRQKLIQQKDEQIQEKEEEILQRDEEIENLEAEKLQIELRARQDELVRSRMNVVRKNEMLQEIKKTAVSINNGLKEDNLPAIKRRVVRLIGQIDTNMEHDEDLEAFRSEFDSVHHNFLKLLDERFPQLSHKEKMLCAYIRMNLLSKEIAPLLNISTRGVEISRYRLRQKLGLDSKESLTDFLQKI